jgi:hypothetical protein
VVEQAASNPAARDTAHSPLVIGHPRRTAARCRPPVPLNRRVPIGRHRSRDIAGPG